MGSHKKRIILLPPSSARPENSVLMNIFTNGLRARQIQSAGLFIVALGVTACGGGSDPASINNNNGLPSNADLNNGFHLVSSTGYDESGAVVSMTTRNYDLTSNRIDISSTNYNTNEIGEVFTTQNSSTEYYNEAGMITANERLINGVVRTTTYTLDNRGYIIRSSRNGSTPRNSIYEYDRAGNLIRVLRTFELDPNDINYETHTETRTLSYGSNGALSSLQVDSTSYDPDLDDDITVSSMTQYTSNGAGQITKSETSSPFSDGVFTREFRYDSDGNVVESIDTSSDGFSVRYENGYETNSEPITNVWLVRFKFFPPR